MTDSEEFPGQHCMRNGISTQSRSPCQYQIALKMKLAQCVLDVKTSLTSKTVALFLLCLYSSVDSDGRDIMFAN